MKNAIGSYKLLEVKIRSLVYVFMCRVGPRSS